MMSFVGSKTGLVIVTALVVGLISFATIRYIQGAEQDKVITTIQEKQIERSKNVNENVRTAPVNVDDSLRYLNDRKGN
jgi:ABC-type microcin C transport system permease subunit YejB